MTDLAKQPLYAIQSRALIDEQAARECAVRYTRTAGVNSREGGPYFGRIVKAYLSGLAGEADPYRHGRGGNYVRPLRRAFRAGAELRAELRPDVIIVGSDRGPVECVVTRDETEG